MRKEPQIGIRVGVPAFFALELEDVYKHTQGAHRALAFPDFLGLLIGLGLEAYRKGNAAPEARQEEAPEDTEDEEGEDRTTGPLNLFDMDPRRLPELFKEFEEAMEQEEGPNIRLVKTGGTA
jgi:hypothetical protein